jgi:glycerol-3-phosphate dehydrogenase
MPGEFDCLVLGGGITGAGVARDAALRGLRTVLVDSHDFASGTSHLTSKLIHGGLRYLEHCQFRLVAEGIIERDRLLNRMAPNLVAPLRFVIPFEGSRFPKWLLTVCGLQFYGLAELLRSGRRSSPLLAAGMKRHYPALLPHPFGVNFWDAQTNDARLVMATVRTAYAAGAAVHNYTSVTDVARDKDGWNVRLRCELDDREWSIRARSIINATGPWSPMTAGRLGVEPQELMWVKGSHLLLRRPPDFGRDAVIINSVRDRRALWIIPWETRLIVGSTESLYRGDLRNVRPESDEVDDLFDSFTRYFARLGLTRRDILGAYAGVRPIVSQDGESENSLSRRHQILIDSERRLITITGGKLTTFRNMAEQAVDRAEHLLGRPPATHAVRCRLRRELLWPGLARPDMMKLTAALERNHSRSDSSAAIIPHLVRHYGSQASTILDAIAAEPRLGEPLYDGLPYCLAELAYLCESEKVGRLLDLVKRRTPLYFLTDNGSLGSLRQVVEHVAPILGWSPARQAEEWATVADEFRDDTQAFADQGDLQTDKSKHAVCA